MAKGDEPTVVEPKSGEVNPDMAAVFRDGDTVPTNAKSKSISGKALKMNMGFDCNGVHGNPGDLAFFFNNRCMVISDE